MRPHNHPRKRPLAKDGPTPAEVKWRPILDQWRHSGLIAAAFCRQRDIPASALLHWKKQVLLRDQRRQAERAASEASRNALKFLPVQVLEPAAAAPGSL